MHFGYVLQNLYLQYICTCVLEGIRQYTHAYTPFASFCYSYTVHEAELKKLCWIPFGIQTLTVGQEGGLFSLQPQSEGLSEDRDVIMLEVPANAVNRAVCDELCIRYGVIVYGPFDVPEGYQLGSMAVYIYFEEDHAVQPVLLHLPHWSGKDSESSLKCAIAPHRLEEGEEKYKFRLTEDGDFHSREGSGVIAIDGHCSLFAKALKQKASLQYYATGLEKEVKDGVNLYVLITYASQVWLQVRTYEFICMYTCLLIHSHILDVAMGHNTPIVRLYPCTHLCSTIYRVILFGNHLYMLHLPSTT